MGKPMIGILPLYDDDKESYWMLPGYMKAIEEAGGIPVMLPLTSDAEIVAAIANAFDGFVFTGGHDVNPELYGEGTEDFCGKLCTERDAMEAMLFKHAIGMDKPSFGICRGLQLFNVLLGGTLYQDIPIQLTAHPRINHKQKPPYTEPVHSVAIDRESLLHRIVRTDSLSVNSYHHQGIKVLSSQLEAAAKAEDGLIEAVVMPEKRFILAVQWHPEFNYKADRHSYQLFLAFVSACTR
ncbi:gamma-glutamyl-gamma-aminobutyrate hydrolase family protein [Paenibacillus chartarius]|uniref:Gamma-glutamyl-gamma-aminobutyrate hydrolase family protein n=1 Tax=Paenibacillus chartarius TaxID=747481 RepID=A0ABV6DM15_9BACL